MAKILLAQHLSNWLALTVYTYWKRKVWHLQFEFTDDTFFLHDFSEEKFEKWILCIFIQVVTWTVLVNWKVAIDSQLTKLRFQFQGKSSIHTHGKSSKTYVSKCLWYSPMFSYPALDTHECAHTHLLQNRWEKLRGNLWKYMENHTRSCLLCKWHFISNGD